MTAVVLFIHKRAETTSQVFSVVRQYKPERLYIFADGARAGKDEESFVKAARWETEKVDWDCEVFRHYSSENHGLSKSIFRGLDKVFESESSAIILEDDCLPSSAFFPFAEKLLNQFEHSEEVAIISGTNLSGVRTSTDPYMFIGHPYIWGWATWANTWRDFRSHVPPGHSFYNSFAAIPGVFSKILFSNLLWREKSLGTWDIAFSKYVHSKKLLCVMPSVNLIKNLGFDEYSTNTNLERIFVSVDAGSLGAPIGLPLRIRRNRSAERQISIQMFRRLVASLCRERSLVRQVIKRAFAPRK